MDQASASGPYTTANAVGRALRRLGYDVSARANGPWVPTARDRLELDRFVRDAARAEIEIQPDPMDLGFQGVLAWASEDPAEWRLETLADSGCCDKCHFRFEEIEIWPHLINRDRAMLQAEHDRLRMDRDLRSVRAHIDREMRIFRAAGLPPALLERVEADHRRIVRRHGG